MRDSEEFKNLKIGDPVYSFDESYSVEVKKLDFDNKLINDSAMQGFCAIPIKTKVMERNGFTQSYPRAHLVEWKLTLSYRSKKIEFVVYSARNGDNATNILYRDSTLII